MCAGDGGGRHSLLRPGGLGGVKFDYMVGLERAHEVKDGE